MDETPITKANLKDRPTVSITTPNGHVVVLYEYITGGEMRRFQALFLEDMNAKDLVGDDTNAPDGSAVLDKIKASTLLQAQELALELLVVSVDDDHETPHQLVLSLKPEDTDFVIAAVDKYTTPGEGKKK